MRGKKKYADGGITGFGTPQTIPQTSPQSPTTSAAPNTYPFTSMGSSSGSGSNANTTNVTVGQTPGTQEPASFKRGGKVRGGGCEQRGKTRGRMV